MAKGVGMRGGDAKTSAKKIDLHRLRDDLQGDIDRARILSLTEKPGNLLMWTHYASSHTGVCLEFAVSVNEPSLGRAQPVIYSNIRRRLNSKGTEEENVNPALLTKSAD